MSWWTDNFYGREQTKTWSTEQGKTAFTSAAGPGNLGRMSNTTYTGCDIKILAHGDTGPFELTAINTFSYSLHRPKSPVRALGYVNAKGYARGTRTIAGSIIFTVFNKHPLHDMAVSSDDVTPSVSKYEKGKTTRVLLDQLPPFDVTIVFVNEYGNISRQAFYGIDISTEGQVLSISDLMIENSVNYTCLHMDPMVPIVDIYNAFQGAEDYESNQIAALFEDAYALPTERERIAAIAVLNATYNTQIRNVIGGQGLGDALNLTLPSVITDQNSRDLLAASMSRFR